MAVGTALGARLGDYRVKLAGNDVIRAQYAEVNNLYPAVPVMELGNKSIVGLVEDPRNASGTLTVLFRGDTNIVQTVFGTTCKDWANVTTTFRTPGTGMTDVYIATYTVNARVGEFASWTATLLGNTGSGLGFGEIGTVDDAEPIAHRTAEILIQNDAGTMLVRAQAFTGTVTINRSGLNELGTLEILGYAYDPPLVRADIDVVQSTADNLPNYTKADDKDLKVTIGTIASKTVMNFIKMVKVSDTYIGQINGWATRRVSYMSKGDTATAGFEFA